MGGPSAESWRKSEEARLLRRAALRTRYGVVDLSEYRGAVQAAQVLRGMLHEPPWLLGVSAVVAADVGLEIVVTILREHEMLRRCLPSSVNDVPVRVVVKNR
jgi:hypothetical protein